MNEGNSAPPGSTESSRPGGRNPAGVVRAWVDAFNRADADALAALYAVDAVNHQVVQDPVEGRDAIRAMFARDFERAAMTCIVENVFEDGDWAILEWRDPKGLRGCGFFTSSKAASSFSAATGTDCPFCGSKACPFPLMTRWRVRRPDMLDEVCGRRSRGALQTYHRLEGR